MQLPAGVVGVGVDIVDVDRFAKAMERTPGIVSRVFTAREVALPGDAMRGAASLAARWAAKEAVAKVLVDNTGLQWHHCEVLVGERGEPSLEMSGSVLAASQSRGIGSWLLSLSHDGGMAIAFVVATGAGT